MHLLTSGSGKNRAIFCISSGNRTGASLDVMIPESRASQNFAITLKKQLPLLQLMSRGKSKKQQYYPKGVFLRKNGHHLVLYSVGLKIFESFPTHNLTNYFNQVNS